MLIPSSLMQSMASFVSQNVGAGNEKRAKKTMFVGIGVGLVIGCIVFMLVMFKGDLLTAIFTTDEAVIQNGYDYLKGFALETIVTAILFSMIGYFNGQDSMGNDSGTYTDTACPSAVCVLYEYTA